MGWCLGLRMRGLRDIRIHAHQHSVITAGDLYRRLLVTRRAACPAPLNVVLVALLCSAYHAMYLCWQALTSSLHHITSHHTQRFLVVRRFKTTTFGQMQTKTGECQRGMFLFAPCGCRWIPLCGVVLTRAPGSTTQRRKLLHYTLYSVR